MIASLKVGNKTKMMLPLLGVFDEEGCYEWAKVQWGRQSNGCKGLEYAGKATFLDAMKISKDIWDSDAKYARLVAS